MAYAGLTTVANIESYFQGLRFDATSTVTAAEVTHWIDQVTAIIYGALASVYVIPDTGITDSSDLLQLSALADVYVVANVKFTTGAIQTRALRDGQLLVSEWDTGRFYKWLERYVALDLVLVNTPKQSAADKLSVYSYNASNDIVPEMMKGVDQW